LVNNPWKFFETNVCFSFLFGYFEIAGQNDPKRRFDFFFVSGITQHFSSNWFLVVDFFVLFSDIISTNLLPRI